MSLDTENYRAKREEALRKLAARMANRCRKTGKRVALEPMNPYERRILHSARNATPPSLPIPRVRSRTAGLSLR